MAPTQPTEWGAFSLMEAQQSLFRTAALDPDVTKFILLSGDSIPLYRFDALYRKLTADGMGYIRKIEKKKSERSLPHMAAWPKQRPFKWSLSSQWVILNRRHVTMLEENFPMLRSVFGQIYIPDEHMYIIFFDGFGELSSFHLRSPTHVRWDSILTPIRTLVPGNIIKHIKPAGNRACSENHRNRPHTFHAEELTNVAVANIYKSGGLFLRKICRLAQLNIDFSREEILQSRG